VKNKNDVLLYWPRPLTSYDASKYLLTTGFVAYELYKTEITALEAKLKAAQEKAENFRINEIKYKNVLEKKMVEIRGLRQHLAKRVPFEVMCKNCKSIKVHTNFLGTHKFCCKVQRWATPENCPIQPKAKP
jgi:hypothetical protein